MKAMFSVAKAVATISLILGAILLMTCGGGGGGSDGGSGAGVPPPPGPGDTEKFFPDAVGDAWYYNAKSSSSVVPAQEERFFEQVTVTSTKMVGGFLTKVFEDASTLEGEDPIEDYYSKDADGVTNHGNNDPSDTLTASIVPYREAKFPVTVGLVTEISKSDVDFGEDLDGDGSNERVDFTLRISVDGFEPQTVPAGTFSRTAKRTSKIDGNVRVSSGGPNLPFTIIENVWLAPGAGVIKQVVTVTIAGETLQESYEARGYQVDGIAHGMNLPYAFVEGLVPANSDIYMPGPPQIAADGSGFLLATIRQTGLQVTTPVTKIIAAFGDADGKILREVDVTTPQPSLGGGRPYDVAYDGTNYLLVYSAGTLNATPNPLLGTRISPTGTVLDGAAGFEIDEGTADVAAVAYGASSYLVVFTRFDNTINLHQLFGRFVTPGGSVVGAAEFPIGPRDQNQVFPDVAFDGTNFLATWQQSPGSASDPADTHIMAARVTEAGVVLEPNGFAISTTPTGSYMPRVAFGGGLYLVVWEDGRNSGVWYERDIYATRVSTAGELLDGPAASGGIRITGGASYQPRYAHIVYSGAEFLVTWAAGSFGSIPGPAGIYGARVSTGGTVTVDDGYGIIVSGRPPTTTTAHYEFPNAVRVGSRLIIAWLDNGENIGQTKGMRAVTVYSLE